MLPVLTAHNEIRIGGHFSVSFQRTLRLPEDEKTYALPPGLGKFPIRMVEDYKDRVPASWASKGGVFISMYQREALWLAFKGVHWRPNAVKVGVGMINALNGRPWVQSLSGDDQDYVVVPNQPWLDGINAGKGLIRQFVAMPLGMGFTVEGQVTGNEEHGGLQIIVYDPKSGKFPDEAPHLAPVQGPRFCIAEPATFDCAMGLAAGGKMRQQIYPDEYGVETWDQNEFGRVYIHIVNSMMYREITGSEPPPTPVTAKQYAGAGLPWFDLYDQDKGTLAESSILTGVQSTGEIHKKLGIHLQDGDTGINVPEGHVKKIRVKKGVITDGNW